MKIVFLRSYDFPMGGAAQNRLLGICRGLIEDKNDVEVHQYLPAKLNIPQNLLKEQIYKDVRIFNHAWRSSPVKNKVGQLLGIIVGIFFSIVSLIKSNNRKNIDYIFINSDKNIYILPFYILSRIIGSKIGRDLNEYPSFIINPNKFNKLHIAYKKATNYIWFDIITVISNNLETYYKSLARKKTKFMYLPVTVDFDRFNYSCENSTQNYLTYCGDLSQVKDGVLTLIDAFAILNKKYPQYKLKLIGATKDKIHMRALKNKIIELGLSEQVLLTGYVNPEEIPFELYNSRLLLLARPDSIQNQGGFPTKLGEYLATSVPVVVTSVGEIPKYLTDGKSAFLAVPNSIKSFADSMIKALDNRTLSMQVGLNGRKIAEKYFSHSKQGKLVSMFLKENL